MTENQLNQIISTTRRDSSSGKGVITQMSKCQQQSFSTDAQVWYTYSNMFNYTVRCGDYW